MADTTDPDPPPEKRASPANTGELAAEDFYFDAGLLVFTSAYHLKRGFCCDSGCRHCPYKVPHRER